VVVLPRLAWRSARYAARQQDLWGSGNRATWHDVLGRRSILLHMAYIHYSRRREYEAVWEEPAYVHLHFVRLALCNPLLAPRLPQRIGWSAHATRGGLIG
jgi:hypothetical protein